MRMIGHFIGGREVKGTSGRFADVFEPMTGDVQAQVALASKAELRAAVENAKAAQPEWGATNPQRRVRVLMKFLELVARDNDALAELLAREHGKTIPDAKGDILRGVEVVEFALGIPQMMKGEYTEGAGPGIDIYSMRQPLGRRRRHHAVQFSGDDPDVEIRARDRLRQCVYPEAVGTRPRRADEARRADAGGRAAAGHPQRRQRRQGSGRCNSRRSRHRGGRLCRLVRDRPVYLRAGGGDRQALRSVSAAPRTTPSSCRMPTWIRPSMRWWEPDTARPASAAWRCRSRSPSARPRPTG